MPTFWQHIPPLGKPARFKRKDVFESLQHVLPSSYTHDEKLRKIGNLLRRMAKDELIINSSFASGLSTG